MEDAFIAALCGAVLDRAPAAEPTGRAKDQIAVTVCGRPRGPGEHEDRERQRPRGRVQQARRGDPSQQAKTALTGLGWKPAIAHAAVAAATAGAAPDVTLEQLIRAADPAADRARDVAQADGLDAEYLQDRGDQLGPGPRSERWSRWAAARATARPGSRRGMLAVAASPTLRVQTVESDLRLISLRVDGRVACGDRHLAAGGARRRNQRLHDPR
ncbi:MAG TPA: hypothetical protein VHN14_18605 [Kofleriaceae bacterium]|nr:hypothetical protein [Kofleriaceae bacterium]